MHPDLVLIQALWETDRAADEAKARARSLKQAVDVAQAHIDTLAVARETLDAERAALKEKEAELQRLLDRYVIRRDRSAKLLKGGSSLDYLTVQKQLEQCSAKVDELELGVMDCMEKQEEMSGRSNQLTADAEAAVAHHQQERSRWVDEGGIIRVDLKRLDAEREVQWSGFPKDLHSHYIDLRRRNRDVVVPIENGNCSACQMTVNVQVRVDLNSSKRVHTCRGCGRYLTLPVDDGQDEA